MKKKFEYTERIGLPGGPNEYITHVSGIFSTEGYKRNSPDVNNPYNIIPSGNITMKGVDFPVMGTDNLGNTKAMIPGNDYKFPGDMVFEIPLAQTGGGVKKDPRILGEANAEGYLPYRPEGYYSSQYNYEEDPESWKMYKKDDTIYRKDHFDNTYQALRAPTRKDLDFLDNYSKWVADNQDNAQAVWDRYNREVRPLLRSFDRPIKPVSNLKNKEMFEGMLQRNEFCDTCQYRETPYHVYDNSNIVLESEKPAVSKNKNRYHREYNPFTKTYEAMSPQQNRMLEREAYKLKNQGIKVTPDNMPVFENRQLYDVVSRKPAGERSMESKAGFTLTEDDVLYDPKTRLPMVTEIANSNEKPKMKYGGGLLTKTMNCNNCGWSWKAADGGNDVDTCHKCGGKALPTAQGGAEKKIRKVGLQSIERLPSNFYPEKSDRLVKESKPVAKPQPKTPRVNKYGQRIPDVNTTDAIRQVDEYEGTDLSLAGQANSAGDYANVAWNVLTNPVDAISASLSPGGFENNFLLDQNAVESEQRLGNIPLMDWQKNPVAEVASMGTYAIPGVGLIATGKDLYQDGETFYNDPSLANAGMLGLSAVGIKPSIKELQNLYKYNPRALKEIPYTTIARIQKPGQTAELALKKYYNELEAAGTKLSPKQKLESLKVNREGYGQGFSKNPRDLSYYSNPNIQQSRGYQGDSELLVRQIPTKELKNYNVKNLTNEFQKSYGSTSPSNEFILPYEEILKTEKWSPDRITELQKLMREEQSQKPHWLKGYKTIETPEYQTGGEYKVKSGDTFYGIANKNKISWEDLKKANPGIDIQNLKLNQTIKFPVQDNVQDNVQKPQETSWSDYMNPWNWGVSDRDDDGDFKQAFRAAREAGEDEFMWYGTRYTTDLKPTSAKNTTVQVEKASDKLNKDVKTKPFDGYKITPQLLYKQAFVESRLDPKAKNSLGYMGLGQIGEAVIKDYKKATGVKEVDPFDPKQNHDVQEWSMNELYNASFIDKPGATAENRLIKALASYNYGRGKVKNILEAEKAKGNDIYKSNDWTKQLPKETREYIDMIVYGGVTEKRPDVQTNFKKATEEDGYKDLRELYKYQSGGEIDNLTIYKNYIDGVYDNTPEEKQAKKVYDKLNRVYYKEAKIQGTTVPNYIMSTVMNDADN